MFAISMGYFREFTSNPYEQKDIDANWAGFKGGFNPNMTCHQICSQYHQHKIIMNKE
jgi:hypothetical protein